MKPRHRRLIWILCGVAALGVAVTLILNAVQSNLVFFFTPTQIAAGEAKVENAYPSVVSAEGNTKAMAVMIR